jgi:hypothetical protein
MAKFYGPLEKAQLEQYVVQASDVEGRIGWDAGNDQIKVSTGAAVKTIVDTTALTNSLPTITGTRAAPSAIVAGTGVAFTGSSGRGVWFIEGSGGAVDISANPQIAAGSAVGQMLTLVGRNATNTVLFEDGTGLSLNGSAMLGLDDVLGLMWDGTNWIELYRRA